MNHDIVTRRKRLRYRTSHTGTRETDILLGGYVAARGGELTAEQATDLEELLDGANDPEILDWIIGRLPLPERFNNSTLAEVMAYVRERRIS